MKLDDLMPDVYEYPSPTRTPLVDGVRYDYISSTHLDGWINYVSPVDAYVITRYAEDGYEGNTTRVAAWHNNPPFHTSLRAIADDDVVLLAKGDPEGDWWLFEYDCDVSDCSIGRFTFGGVETDILHIFEKYVENVCKRLTVGYQGVQSPPIRIDVAKLKGWLSW